MNAPARTMSQELTVRQIENAIIKWMPSEIALPNVHFDFGEVDMITVSKSGYLSEYEIKRSIADLKREAKKARWDEGRFTSGGLFERFRRRIKKYYVVIPEPLAQQARELLPFRGAGLIAAAGDVPYLHVIRLPHANPAEKLEPEDWQWLARISERRYWNMRSELRNLQLRVGEE